MTLQAYDPYIVYDTMWGIDFTLDDFRRSFMAINGKIDESKACYSLITNLPNFTFGTVEEALEKSTELLSGNQGYNKFYIVKGLYLMKPQPKPVKITELK